MVFLVRSFAILIVSTTALTIAPTAAAIESVGQRKTLATGLVNPESAVVGFDGRIYISEIGERDKDGDGRVAVLSHGRVIPFAEGMDDPKGIVAVGDMFYVTDKTRIWVVDRNGNASVYLAKEDFPHEPLFLNDIAAGELSDLYVSDSGPATGGNGRVYRISFDKQVKLIADENVIPGLQRPNGVLVGKDGRLLMADVLAGTLYRGNADHTAFEKIAEGLGGADGIVEDRAGNLFVSDVRGGKVFRIRSGRTAPELVAEGFTSAADIAMNFDNMSLLVPDMRGGELVSLTVAP